jgi:putative membrane protein
MSASAGGIGDMTSPDPPAGNRKPAAGIWQLATLAALGAGAIEAHEGHDHGGGGGPLFWDPDLFVLSVLVVVGALYLRGAVPLVKKKVLRRWQVASFAGGWLALLAALVSPIDTLSDVLFSVHMTQHELLMLVAAPLIVIGQPLTPMLRALPSRLRIRLQAGARQGWALPVWRFLTGPVNVWVLHAIILLGWHLPALYQAALRSDLVHYVQHLMFLGVAVLFWWALVHGRYGRLGYGMAVLYVFTTAMYTGALGALLTVSPRIWYPIYEERTAAFGADPLADQQLAGLIMWIPAGVILLIVALGFLAAWLGALEGRARASATGSGGEAP